MKSFISENDFTIKNDRRVIFMILETKKVTFLEAIKDFWKGYFDFKGRSKRSGYWWAMLFIILTIFAIEMIGLIIFCSADSVVVQRIGNSAVIVLLIFILAIIIPGLMLTFRRWRDAGLSSNGILIYFLLLLAFSVISVFYETFGDMLLSLCYLISFALSVLPTDQLTTNSNNAVLKFLFRSKA